MNNIRQIKKLSVLGARFVSGVKRKYPLDPAHADELPVFQYGPSRKEYKRVFSWGNVQTGALGLMGLIDKDRSMLHGPKRLGFAEKFEVETAAVGFGFTALAVNSKTDVKLYGTGLNTDSQIGYHAIRTGHPLGILYYLQPISLPFRDPENSKILKLAAGRAHLLVLTSEGLFLLGNNAYGQCGRKIVLDEDYSKSNLVHHLSTLHGKRIVDVACGQDHSIILAEDGSVYSCGWGADGQTGLGHYNNTEEFTLVKGDIYQERITKLACRSDFVLALNDKGETFGWGNTEYGQIPLPSGDQQLSIPTSIEQPSNMASNNMTDSELINGWSPWKRSRKPSTGNENVYDLYAICYHHGTDLETGHYTAACKNPYDLNWYLYDDAKVKNLSKDANDLSPVLVNNSAYILFYQRRSMGNSSNNSSAASTSSVGSGSDHWVCRMPKFVPPKFAKQPEKVEKTVSIKDDLKPIEKESEQTGNKTDEIVALRNSQNTLYSSRKSLEIKVTEPLRNSPTLSLNLNRSSSEISTKKPIFTTSVYINSPGSDAVADSPKKLESIKVILREPTKESGPANVTNDNEKPDVYTTTASIQRHSDIEKGASKTQLNWMSPQPIKKSASTQEQHTVFSV